jgi:HNH endonuclease
MMDLFAHPPQPHERRHGPRGYATYDGYKSWLRDEFTFRCVYCLERETWYPDRAASFSVEHVVPQSEDASLVCEYTNLIYACTRCNSNRRDLSLLNPTEAAFGEHIRPGENGVLIGLTAEGQDLIDILHLNENPSLKVRQKYLWLFSLKETYPADAGIEKQFLEAFGFPDDMPDLRTMRPPGGNSRPGSETTCYFALRQAGSLPATY